MYSLSAKPNVMHASVMIARNASRKRSGASLVRLHVIKSQRSQTGRTNKNMI